MTTTFPCVSSKIADRKLVFPDPGCPPSKKAVGDSTAFLLESILLNYHLSDSQIVCQ